MLASSWLAFGLDLSKVVSAISTPISMSSVASQLHTVGDRRNVGMNDAGWSLLPGLVICQKVLNRLLLFVGWPAGGQYGADTLHLFKLSLGLKRRGFGGYNLFDQIII